MAPEQAYESGLEHAPYSTLEPSYQAEPEKQAVPVPKEEPHVQQLASGSIFTRGPSWLLPVLGVSLLLATGLGVGLGVGLSNKKDSDDAAPAPAPAPASATPTPVVATSVVTIQPTDTSGGFRLPSGFVPPWLSLIPTSTAAPTPSGKAVTGNDLTITRDCPDANSTLFTHPTNQTFIKHCSYLYTPAGAGADVDVFNRSKTRSLDECISYCAQFNAIDVAWQYGPCTSVTWRTDPEDKLFGYCWGQYETQAGRGEEATNGTVDTAAVDSALLISLGRN